MSSWDINQDYTQFMTKLQRKLYFEAPEYVIIDDSSILILERPFHELF